MIDMEVPHPRPYSQPNQEGIFSGFYRQYEDSRVTFRMWRAPSRPTGRRAWFPGLPLRSLEACARRSLPPTRDVRPHCGGGEWAPSGHRQGQPPCSPAEGGNAPAAAETQNVALEVTACDSAFRLFLLCNLGRGEGGVTPHL